MPARKPTSLLVLPALIAAGGLLMLPGAVRLAGRRQTALDGVVTLADAVAACRRSGLAGWELIGYAQNLVARKFAIYTVWNLWDTPAQAFAFGMGYCTQYNLALGQILRELGFVVQAVSSSQVAVNDEPDWRLGHTWLRVRFAGEVRDVCAGHVDNTPGCVRFTPVKPVGRSSDLILFLLHLGMIVFVGGMGWRAWLTGGPAPAWTYAPRLPD